MMLHTKYESSRHCSLLEENFAFLKIEHRGGGNFFSLGQISAILTGVHKTKYHAKNLN
jgi:hypothetical protein